MAYVKTIVCLANSFKPPHGRCVAGIEMVGKNKYGPWIRPISPRPTAELQQHEYKYTTGACPKLLDVIDVPLSAPAPASHQTENHQIGPNQRWFKRSQLKYEALEQLHQQPDSLWTNRLHTKYGLHDCVTPAEAAAHNYSLLLIKMPQFAIEIATHIWDGVPSLTYRGKFTYNGADYSLRLTDPAAIHAFSWRDPGEYPLSDVYLSLSLTEPFQEDGRCHKLVSAIHTDPPLGTEMN